MKKAILSLSLVLLLISIGRAYSSNLPKVPMLRMETGMHTGPISKIAIDSENRFLVTGSSDKTVRIWELLTGRLLKVLRPPIGEGHIGMIYAVAISPDGKTIACGGRTTSEEGTSYSIYLFDRENGRMTRSIAGLPEVIRHLAYSMDGKFLVAAMGKNGGIRIYQTSDYSMVAEDKDYGDYSFRVDFDGKGRLVTASFDGFVRLYGNDFKLIIKKKVPGGNKPFVARFSPDGENVAVSFGDSTKGGCSFRQRPLLSIFS